MYYYAIHSEHYRKSGNYIGTKGAMGSRSVRESKSVRESEVVRSRKGVGILSIRARSVSASRCLYLSSDWLKTDIGYHPMDVSFSALPTTTFSL